MLSEIDPLTPTDVTAAAQMLRYADNQGADSLKKLVQGIIAFCLNDAWCSVMSLYIAACDWVVFLTKEI